MPSPGVKSGASKGKSKGKAEGTERQRWKWWRYNEMFALLDVWSLPNIQEELDGTKRNTHVYNKMADLLVTRGTKRTPNQVREKMKTLKRAYLSVASKPDRQLEGKKKMLFERMETILSGRKKPAEETSLVAEQDKEPETPTLSAPGSPVQEDDKRALHLMLSLGENPCQLREDEAFQNGAVCEVLVNEDDSREITIESPSPSLDIQSEGFPPTRTDRPRKYHFAEVLADRLVSKFVDAQRELEKEFLSIEEHRLNEEVRLVEAQRLQDKEMMDKIVELDERRRQDDREHELRLFAMLTSCLGKTCGGDASAAAGPPSAPAQFFNWEFAGTFRPTNAKPPGSPTRSKDSQK